MFFDFSSQTLNLIGSDVQRNEALVSKLRALDLLALWQLDC